jgi:hypothetical protein
MRHLLPPPPGIRLAFPAFYGHLKQSDFALYETPCTSRWGFKLIFSCHPTLLSNMKLALNRAVGVARRAVLRASKLNIASLLQTNRLTHIKVRLIGCKNLLNPMVGLVHRFPTLFLSRTPWLGFSFMSSPSLHYPRPSLEKVFVLIFLG